MDTTEDSSYQISALTLQLSGPGGFTTQAYWTWRAQRDLCRHDALYACLALLRAVSLLTASRNGATSSVAVAMALLAAWHLLVLNRASPATVASVRMFVVVTARCLWAVVYCMPLRPDAAGAATEPCTAQQLAFAVGSWVQHMFLQPLLQPVPFAVLLPLQLLETGLLLHCSSPVLLQLERQPQLVSAMLQLHQALENVFHISMGFLLVTPCSVLQCGVNEPRQVAWFLVVFCGLLLPLYFAYCAELVGKAEYVLLTHRPQAAEAAPNYAIVGLSQLRGADVGPSGSREIDSASSSTSGMSSGASIVAGASAGQAPACPGRAEVLSSNGSSGRPEVSLSQLQLVGWLQPVNRELLLAMMHTPGVWLRDGAAGCLIMAVLAWGMCKVAGSLL